MITLSIFMLIKLLEMVSIDFAALNKISYGSFSECGLRLNLGIHDSFKSIFCIFVIRLVHLTVTSII